MPHAPSHSCRHCGYILDGLPSESRCPECGRPKTSPAGSDEPMADMPEAVICAYRLGAWCAAPVATIAVLGVAARWIAPRHVTETVFESGQFIVAALGWGAVWLILPGFRDPTARGWGFGEDGVLRRVARWAPAAWMVAAGIAIAAPVPAPAPLKPVIVAVGLASVAAIVLVSVMLGRLARWTRDDDAAKAFIVAAWGLPAAPWIAAAAHSSSLAVGGPGLRPWQALLVALAIAIALSLPLGLWSLVHALHFAVLHHRDQQEREERRRERADRFAAETAARVAAGDRAARNRPRGGPR